MSDKRIVVDSSSLQQCVSNYTKARALVMDAVQDYVGALAALSRDYTGAAAAAMSLKVVKLTNDITTAAGRAMDAISELKVTDEKFQANESKLASAATSLDVGEESPFV